MAKLAVAHRSSTTPDGVLVQEAAAGSGVSYGELYDRHAPHVYNYCLRLTGSPEDAADATQEAFLGVLRRLLEDDRPVLHFSSYLFAAARNESYALMRRRSRVQVSERPPEDPARMADLATEPEAAVLRRDAQEAIRAANAKLPPRHREVLALRELGDRSYDEIGRIMGISENGAAQLIWRARSKMREAMTAGAVASVVATSPECERAQLLLSRMQDGEAVDEFDRAWLNQHLDECGSCRSAKGMLLEVGAFYAAWVPVAAIAGLKAETLTAAGGIVGADWGGAAAGGAAAGGGGTSVGGVAAAAGGLAAVGVALAAILSGGDGVEPKAAQAPDPPAMSERAKARTPAVAAPSPVLLAQRAARLVAAATPPEPAARKPPSPRERSAPRELPAPRPNRPPPPTERSAPPAPPRQQPSSCTWSGAGNGPGGCPPGHGGVPPGKGGTPPGRSGAGGGTGGGSAKRGGADSGTPPGHGGVPPGHGGVPPGRVGKP